MISKPILNSNFWVFLLKQQTAFPDVPRFIFYVLCNELLVAASVPQSSVILLHTNLSSKTKFWRKLFCLVDKQSTFLTTGTMIALLWSSWDFTGRCELQCYSHKTRRFDKISQSCCYWEFFCCFASNWSSWMKSKWIFSDPFLKLKFFPPLINFLSEFQAFEIT